MFGRKGINDAFGLGCIVGMLLINNDRKLHTVAVSIRNTVKQVLLFTVPDGGITPFRDKLPVDKGGAAGNEATGQRFKQILCHSSGHKFAHFISALFFQIALAGAEPYKRHVI